MTECASPLPSSPSPSASLRARLAILLLVLTCMQPVRAAPSPSETASPSAAPVSAPTLRVQGDARPGGALFVTVAGVDTTAGPATLRWLDLSYPLAAEGAVLRAVLPIARNVKAGRRALRLQIADGGTLERMVSIRKAAYGHQSIWLPADMLSTYDSPRAKADDRRILEATREFTSERLWRGPFRLPTTGPLSTRYGLARTYNGWRQGWHKGLDIAAGSGAPIRAPAGARVAIVAPGMLVNGNATLLDHGLGVFSLYLHQSRFDVRSGQRVAVGQRIGRVGSTGAGTGPHLHWACYVHGLPIDPGVLLHAPW